MMRLGYDGRRPATARPASRVGPDPVEGDPTRTHVRLGRLVESGMGGECGSERDHTVTGKTCPTVSGQQAHQLLPPPMPPTGAGIVPGGSEGTRRYAIKAWSGGAGRRRPPSKMINQLIYEMVK